MQQNVRLTSDSSVPQVIDELNAGWRNEVVRALGMDSSTFQMAQGMLGLQSEDSSALFRMADSVPPQSTTAYYDPSGKNKRSTAYNGLLHAMLPTSSGNGLRAALGDQYANWIAYRNADKSDDTQEALFKKWANRHLDPGKEAAALTAFKEAASDPLNLALDNYVNKSFYTTFSGSASQMFALPNYSCTIDVARNAINSGSSATINYNSATAKTSSTGTTVSGSASGFYDIFNGAASGSFEQLNQLATSSEFTISGTIGQYATVVSNAAGWYDGSLVSRAYNGKNDNTIWDPNSNAGTWDSFFGANGSLARRMSSLLLVSGYDLVVTSKATYSASQFQQIKTQASFGIWPFFSASASSTHTQTYTHNEDGTLSVRYQLNKGLIAIWGATIQNAPN